MSNRLNSVMEQTLPYIWHRYGIHPLPRHLQMNEELDAMRKAVYVQTFIAASKWHGYLAEHFERMTLNQKAFARYCVFACYEELEEMMRRPLPEDYKPVDLYLKILGLVAYFGVYCHSRGKTRAVDLVPHILTRFFSYEASDVQDDSAFWMDLHHLIVKGDYLGKHLEICQKVKGVPPHLIKVHSMVGRYRVLARVTAADVEGHDLTEEVVRALDRPVVKPPAPDPAPPKMMTASEKKAELERCKTMLRNALSGLQEVQGLLKEAYSDLEYKFVLKKKILDARVQM